MARKTSHSTSSVLAATLFFASGALGLGYQLIWIRRASLVVGSSQIALATVLTSFFLGLGLGSLFVGKHLRSRRISPLVVYGIFEALIGLFALAFPWLFGGVEAVYGALYPLVETSAAASFLLRFALMFVLFLVPTFFMGGTLPLLLDGLVERDRSVGSLTSLLYGLNILGAVAGVLLTGYFGIPELGLRGTNLLCGLGNLGIGAVALLAFRGRRPLHVPDASRVGKDRVPTFFLVLGFVSGLAAIGYQVAWARYFSIFNVASVYLTAVLLAVFLAALATGSMILAPLLTARVRPLRVLAVAQACVPILVYHGLEWWRLARYRFSPATPPETGEVVPSWSMLSETVDAIFLAPLFQIGLVLFLPVTLLGVGLPALIAAATERSAQLRAHAGALVFWNTLGSSAGGFIAGYLLIPFVGLRGTLFFLGLLSLFLSIAAEWRLGLPSAPASARLDPRRWARPGYVLSALALVSALLFLRHDVTSETIREHGIGAVLPQAELVDVVEGPLTTAYVLESEEQRIVAAGNVILAVLDHTGPSTQAIQGHIPALFYPRPGTPRRCLGIALGSGQSFGALLTYPIEHLDVVDISSEMVDLSLQYFENFNHGLGRDERVTIRIDDGRHFVDRAPDADYDVVSMEPPPPTAEGVFSLYSLEFYRGVERILRDGGVFMQWLPLYMVTPNDLRAMIKTQANVFPHTFVIKAGSYDFMIVSFKGSAPPRFETEWIVERIRTFERERLVGRSRWPGGRYRMASPMGVVSMLLTAPEDVARMDSPLLLDDDRQRLSYSCGDREILRRHRDDKSAVARLSFAALPLTPFESLQRYFVDPLPVAELDEERALTLPHFQVPPPSVVATATRSFEQATDPRLKVEWALRLARLHDGALDRRRALEWIERAAGLNVGDPAESWLAGVTTIARNQIATFAGPMADWVASLPRELRATPLVAAVQAELSAHEQRESRRLEAYLLP